MVSFRSLVVFAPLLAGVIAQAKIAFTSTPAVLNGGDSYNITWGGGDGDPCTLTLRRGNPQDLDTITTIASNVDGSYYLWKVPQDLPSGDDYALQITQGQSDINYSGLFTIQGGSGNATTTASSNSTMSMTSMTASAGTGTAMSRNTTFSSASLTSTDTFNFGETSTTRRATSATSQSTSAPNSNNAPIRAGSSAALILGIVAAVMMH